MEKHDLTALLDRVNAQRKAALADPAFLAQAKEHEAALNEQAASVVTGESSRRSRKKGQKQTFAERYADFESHSLNPYGY